MNERRAQIRERVMFGATAASRANNSQRECVVRNFSARGATLHFSYATRLSEDIDLTIARKGRCYPAKIVWSRDNVVGVEFSTETSSHAAPDADMEDRLRTSERKARQLHRRVKNLLGEG